MTAPTPEQIENVPQKDVIRLLRNLKNAAYSHGVTDQTEYYSDKKYRVAQENSEAAFEELRTAIASLQAENARLKSKVARYVWQPIETAPKDGSPVLVFDGEHYAVGYWATEIGEWWVSKKMKTTMLGTHWMPLPAPPASTEDGAE